MQTVAIDAGHGGHDGGAYGAYSKEKDIALAVSLLVEEELKPYVTPFLTRSDDTYLSLSTRPDLANNAKAVAFVSIHCNSADNSNARGWEIFTTPGQNNSDKLATAIGERYGEANPHLKTRFDMSDGDLDKEANFAVIRGTSCPSCLVELGFISNKDEETLLNFRQFQQDSARAIAYGILDFIGIEYRFIADKPVEVAAPLTIEQRLTSVEQRLDNAGL
jgi:N-acetylmuramoyl-L-alanine amidase